MATAFHHNYIFTPTSARRRCRTPPSPPLITLHPDVPLFTIKQCSSSSSSILTCKETEISSVAGELAASGGENWVPVVPLSALPKGERRVIIQDGETILLLWYKDTIFAIENRSPAEGAYSEGLLNAKLTQDGCIVCPSTDSTFDLRTGAIKEWYPKNPVLRALTPALRNLYSYPAKTDGENIFISMQGNIKSDGAAEIVFSGKATPGFTASDVNVDEVRMVVDEGSEGFGFTRKNEIINGKAAIIGFLLLLDFELLTEVATRQTWWLRSSSRLENPNSDPQEIVSGRCRVGPGSSYCTDRIFDQTDS